MAPPPTMHLIAGVNGAGKTSFYRYHLQEATPGAEFVNADELAKELWPGREEEHIAEAARMAAERRLELIGRMQTFVAETVFSHESKLELVEHAKRLGFRVILYHVHVSSAELAYARVVTRVARGGHDVPVETVKARYERSLALIPRAAAVADITLVFDNSSRGGGRTHTHVMTLENGGISKLRDALPEWVERGYQAALSVYRPRG